MPKIELQPYHSDNIQMWFSHPHTGRDICVELWAHNLGQYTVRAGANSEDSYTGFIGKITDLKAMYKAVDDLNRKGKLFKIYL